MSPQSDDNIFEQLARTLGATPDGLPRGVLPDGERATDIGNAHRLAHRAGERIRFCAATNTWHVYSDGVWAPDSRRVHVGAEARRVAEDLWGLAERVAATDPEFASVIDTWARSSSNVPKLNNMIRAAETLPELAIEPDAFDAHPNHLCVANGVVDLTTGQLLPHDTSWLFTRQVPVAYDPDATAPGFDAFLERIQPDPDTREYLARALGLGLVGANPGHRLFVFFGSGANGKGVLTSIVRGVLGRALAHTGDEKLLFSTDQHPTGLAALSGRRFVVCSEGERGRSWAEARIKKLTGDSELSARFVSQDFFTFGVTFTIVLETNHLPEVLGGDEGIWRRLSVVPFSVTVPESERDHDLGRRLVATEGPGVLAWLVGGAGRALAEGLNDAPEVLAATAAYRAGSTGIADFLGDRCGAPGSGEVSAADIYAAYLEWCDEAGCEPLTQRSLADRLKAEGYANRKDGSGRMRWDLTLEGGN